MKNIYQETIAKVSEAGRFKVDFKNRSLRVGKKYIIKKGEYEGDLGIELRASVHPPTGAVLSEIERLYLRYRHSIPSERSDSKRRTYFTALDEKDLSDEDMLYGERREVAQVELELFILCQILAGGLVWCSFAKDKWFWKSPNIKGLILLKEWIT